MNNYKVVELEQGSQEWLDWRRNGITATESAVIMGISPYKGAYTLYCEKIGLEVPEDLSNNYFVKRGNALEDEVRQIFESNHNTLALPVCVESTINPYLRASLDGLSIEGEVVELKTCCSKVFNSVKDLGVKSPTVQVYNIQVQHQMMIVGANKGYLCFLCPDLEDDNNYLELEIARDEELQAKIVLACEEFYQRIIDKNPPEKIGKERVYTPENDEEFLDFSSKIEEVKAGIALINQLKDEIKAIEESIAGQKAYVIDLMSKANSIKSDILGLRVNIVESKGSIDYAKALKSLAPEVTSDELESFRKKGSVSSRFTLID